MASKYKDCGLPVGCGCQLIQGRCSACNYAYIQSQNNVNTQTK
jgi:hypothetical protein